MDRTFVIVGAGQAGSSLTAKLRDLGFDGKIVLLGEEPELPYQRPPLSKKYLLGDLEKERLHIRPLAFYEQQDITVRTSAHVAGIDPSSKRLTLSDDTTLDYDRLALTTGSRPRLLPAAVGGTLAGVYPVRTLADVDAMAPEFTEGRRLLIIGGGYIGLEAAAVAAARGVAVTLIEMADRILQRVAAPETSDYFRTLHRRHGVDIRESTGLTRLEDDNGRVSRAALADGTGLDVDFALVGIGIAPNAEIAEAAGLEIDNGIAVDAACCTSDPDIFAAGDCASFRFRGERIRLESVQNAIDQADAAAASMLDIETRYVPSPWFWSDQYDVKLQIAGLNRGYDRIVTRPGSREGGLSVWYYKSTELRAVDAMNEPRAYMSGKRWLEAGISPDADKITDPDQDLKTIVG
jgi:3-phenylpropionate/trans-cinnamate dioxygenase ferredoxin reductase subunit